MSRPSVKMRSPGTFSRISFSTADVARATPKQKPAFLATMTLVLSMLLIPQLADLFKQHAHDALIFALRVGVVAQLCKVDGLTDDAAFVIAEAINSALNPGVDIKDMQEYLR